jgi:hypothetical protein
VASHTPSPWRVYGPPHNEPDALTVCAAYPPNDIDVARIKVATVHVSGITTGYLTSPADNAALIASAPDLLRALEKISKAEGRYAVDPLTHASNTIEDMQALAVAAIAEARALKEVRRG